MYYLSKRIFDILASVVGLVILSPLFIIISLWIVLDSRGGVFYKQVRVGKNQKHFKLLKFRSMRPNADKAGQLTVGDDNRVTKVGKFIRKFKLDEFPQLLNIIAGQMSLVGPRPEVPKYVEMYSEEQQKVLDVLPGLTDLATIEYLDEQKILGEAENPEQAYITEIMPAKLALNLKYIEKRSFFFDLGLVFKTLARVFS